MAGIVGQGTTFDLPNYVGELFAASPEDTPLLSAIGGLTGGKEANTPIIEWSGYDLRDPDENRQHVEGDAAPDGEERVRFNVDNVVEIHQETVDVSYTKQAAVGLRNGQNIDGVNAVTAEMPWQVLQSIKQVARDVEASFIRGQYAKPSDNTTPRKTRGILQAIATNVVNLGEAHNGLSAATTVITDTATTLANDDKVVFTDVGGSTGIKLNTVYYIVGKATNAVSVASSKGGSALTIGTATVSFYKLATTAPAKATYDELFQQVWDNGGIAESETATIMVGSSQKLNLSNAYSDGINNRVPDRNVGGVNFETIVTDFGKFNVALNRWMPADAFTILSLEHLNPVFLNIPGKGHFFQDELAKVGASDRQMLYGEIGLEYGNEKAHGVIRGLPTTR
ncbi:SU10 major capsid protein [Humibacter ginsenosidimutans]|uniref:Uncharacterized protein n=1 Tax=Humibacter ginsenosidimutans TaxID=2599293 RepID=A0A5B8M714_9MICO|nr:DUF5309 family protein [Humibacter ginsenosidimutans]QDZ15784.1 hypothetical protein FPZ11_14340 [Humibacter ginsenosidimutans]